MPPIAHFLCLVRRPLRRRRVGLALYEYLLDGGRRPRALDVENVVAEDAKAKPLSAVETVQALTASVLLRGLTFAFTKWSIEM
jgi:hypothetical protein